MEQLLRHQISNFQQLNGQFVSVGYKVPLGKKYYLSSKWIKGDVSKRILVLATSFLSILMTSIFGQRELICLFVHEVFHTCAS